ncbi:MAG: hypothetical protein CMA63_02050 [Euryarchaeota archaeon]|nr:hypothetical protein [Euryarchaeota archaeon]
MRGVVVNSTPLPLPTASPSHGGIAYLDRDGELNIGSPNYINHPEEFIMLKKAAHSVGELRRAGFQICVVTNQSAMMRGLWDEDRMHSIHDRMRTVFLEHDPDAHFDLILACPHRNRDRCACRKPMPGMLRLGERILRNEYPVPRGPSMVELNSEDGQVDWWGDAPSPRNRTDCMVGDRSSDMGAGWAMGVRLFQVLDQKGIAQVIDRILDLEDDGDRFNPVR